MLCKLTNSCTVRLGSWKEGGDPSSLNDYHHYTIVNKNRDGIAVPDTNDKIIKNIKNRMKKEREKHVQGVCFIVNDTCIGSTLDKELEGKYCYKYMTKALLCLNELNGVDCDKQHVEFDQFEEDERRKQYLFMEKTQKKKIMLNRDRYEGLAMEDGKEELLSPVARKKKSNNGDGDE